MATTYSHLRKSGMWKSSKFFSLSSFHIILLQDISKYWFHSLVFPKSIFFPFYFTSAALVDVISSYLKYCSKEPSNQSCLKLCTVWNPLCAPENLPKTQQMTVPHISLFAELQWPLITYRIMCQIFSVPCPFYNFCSLTHLAMNFAIFKTYFL